MGCPCSKRSHPRQAGSQDGAAAPTSETQSGHPPRGYRWNGPEGRPTQRPVAPAAPAPAAE